MPAVRREPTKVEPITYDAVTLSGGPCDGQRLRIQRGCTLSIPTRRKRRPGDVVPHARYEGDSTSGRLVHVGTTGKEPRP